MLANKDLLTDITVKRVGADTIYANNENRKICTDKGIVTCFARKGPKPKDEDTDLHTTWRIIGNLRAMVIEGSLGNQKQHYGVGRIAARNQFSETLLLFFDIHMANASYTCCTRTCKGRNSEKKEHSLTTSSIYFFIFRLMAEMNCYALMLRNHGLRGCHECKIRILCRYSMHLSQYRIKWPSEKMALTE